MKRQHLLMSSVFAVVSLVSSVPATAQTIKVGLSAEPTSLDPHYHNLIPNNQIAGHIFESLVETTADFSFRPGLAESWRALDETTWEFKLRKNVRFHDGSAFDANDVQFTLCRIPKVANSPSPFTIYTKAIKEIDAPDPYTLIIKTKAPYPLLPNELSVIGVISDRLIGGEKVKFVETGCKITAALPATADFNSGKAAIGTGPYKFSEFVKGDYIQFNRNDAYWGKKPQWESVRFRPITNPGSRVAALLSGDVDFIENPPIQDMLRIMKNPAFKVVSDVSVRVIYIAMDQRSDTIVPPEVKGTNERNPFRDERVRKALSMAINRESLSLRVMDSFSKPAEQLLAKNFFGADPLLKSLPYDPDAAQKLLAQAGYPNGFELTLASPNDRYINDAQIAQAIAQMWTKIGVKTNVNAMTASVFFAKRTKNEFGIWLAGWGAQTGEMSSPLRALVATVNKDKGWGAANQAKYSDAFLDGVIDDAMVTVDDTKRRDLLRKASKRSVEKMGVIPVHYEVTPWAMKKEFDYKPRADQFTSAFDITLKP